MRNQDWDAGSCIRLCLKEGTGRKGEAGRLLRSTVNEQNKVWDGQANADSR